MINLRDGLMTWRFDDLTQVWLKTTRVCVSFLITLANNKQTAFVYCYIRAFYLYIRASYAFCVSLISLSKYKFLN